MISYMYGGELYGLKENAIDLYKAADKYLIYGLTGKHLEISLSSKYLMNLTK